MNGRICCHYFARAFTVLAVVTSIFVLSACQSELPPDSEKDASEASSVEELESKVEPNSPIVQEDERDDQSISLEKAAKSVNSFFILHNGMCYPATTASASGQKGGLLIGGSGESHVPVLRMSEGDSLITTRDNESYTALPFQEEGYAEEKATNILTYDEIDGVDPSSLNLSSKHAAAEEILSNRGIVYKDYRWTSSEPTEFVIGRYVGTKWSENTVEIKNRYYVPDWNAEKIILPVTKTHDGYFAIETDALSPGDYLINVYTSISGVDHMFRLTVL